MASFHNSPSLAGLLLLALFACRSDDDKPQDSEAPAVTDGDGAGYEQDDCDDSDAAIHPDAEEVCDGTDNDCDGEVDEDDAVDASTWYPDADGDGYGDDDSSVQACDAPEGFAAKGGDCDDEEAAAFPGNEEVCDGIDNDCDQQTDEDVLLPWYLDADGDGWGDEAVSEQACEPSAGYVAPESLGDCDDANSDIHPDALEICDGIDNDCDGLTDDEDPSVADPGTWYPDADGDGYGQDDKTAQACEQPKGYAGYGGDCDDGDPAYNPGAKESDCADPNDYNCDGSTGYADADGDGWAACAECDDGDAAINPDASEICDGADNDCDGDIDEDDATDAPTWYADADGDGYGDGTSTTRACNQPKGYVSDANDCDDGDASVFPGTAETCNGVDDDCDGDVDEGVTSTWYADSDGDSYGDAQSTAEACDAPEGYVADSSDCDDDDAQTNPVADEHCDGHDDDCDGDVDEDDAVDASTWYADADGDGFGDANSTQAACDQPQGYEADSTDCDDGDAAINPDASELCDGTDNDCDGDTDEDDASDAATWYADGDNDGYGDATSSTVACSQPSAHVAISTDCDDGDAAINPVASELCDGVDNDCDGDVDEEPSDGDSWYDDDDGDGLGDADALTMACSQPSGTVDNAYDCDDTDISEPVVVDVNSGSSTGSGSLTSPFDTIQDGIERADSCVIVYEGSYFEQLDFGGKEVDVWGVRGSDFTVIDAGLSTCDGSDPETCAAVVTMDSGLGSAPSLRGFTIEGGTGHVSSSTTEVTCEDSSASYAGDETCTVTIFEYCGGGIYIEGEDPTLQDLRIQDNILPDFDLYVAGDWAQYWSYSYGGGLCALDANISASELRVYDNFADQGGGIYISEASTLSLSQSEVKYNDASDGGGINVDGASLAVENSVFACNEATTDGGAMFLHDASTTAEWINVSAYLDESDTGKAHGAAVYGSTDTSFTMRNSIVQSYIAAYSLYGVGTGVLDYNDVYNADSAGMTIGGSYLAGTYGISSDPLFVTADCDGTATDDDFSLSAKSPAIDAGDPDSAYDDVDGSTNDMGAYGGPGGEWGW